MAEIDDNDREMWIPDDVVRTSQVSAFMADFWWIEDKIEELHALGIRGQGSKFSTNDTGGTAGHPGFDRDPLKILTTTRESPKDRNGHGTGCSFITHKIAPDAEFITIKVLTDSGNGSMSDINRAYKMAADEGCDFINCSYGDNGGPPIQSDLTAMQAAYDIGVSLIVVAAGNAGFNGRRNTVGRPASYNKHSWCVGAMDRNGNISNFSSGGEELDSAAYGQDMPMAEPSGGYTTASGTSFACPLTTGIKCLLKQVRRKLAMEDLVGPEAWAGWYVEEGFMTDAGQAGKDNRFGLGVINVGAILDWMIVKVKELQGA